MNVTSCLKGSSMHEVMKKGERYRGPELYFFLKLVLLELVPRMCSKEAAADATVKNGSYRKASGV